MFPESTQNSGFFQISPSIDNVKHVFVYLQREKIGSRGLHVATSVRRRLKKKRERKETEMESNLIVWRVN